MTAGGRWAFDLDGTLADALGASRLRPGALALLETLAVRPVTLVLWSAGGDDYARRVAERLGIVQLFSEIVAKPSGFGGRWALPPEWSVGSTTCVDDEPSRLPDGVTVIGVRPWLGGADTQLLELACAVH